MSVNYSIIDSAVYYLELIKNYPILISIILFSIIIVILYIFNKKRNMFKYILTILNIIILLLIILLYGEKILTFKFSNPINNLYFFFLNSLIYIILSTINIYKTKYQKINIIFYSLFLINILFSIFMTIYLKQIDLLVIGNIYPMVIIGNIILLIYYILFIISIFDKKNRTCYNVLRHFKGSD